MLNSNNLGPALEIIAGFSSINISIWKKKYSVIIFPAAGRRELVRRIQPLT
jgi:hypothetical protein